MKCGLAELSFNKHFSSTFSPLDQSSLSEILHRGYSESLTGNLEGIWPWGGGGGEDLICSRMQADCAEMCSALFRPDPTRRIFLSWAPHSISSCKSGAMMLNRSPKDHYFSPTRARPSILSNILSQTSPVLYVSNQRSCAILLADFDCKTHSITSERFSVHTNVNLEPSGYVVEAYRL